MNRLLVKWTLKMLGWEAEESEEHVTRNQKKGGPCQAVAESLREFCFAVMWNAQLAKGQTWIISGGYFQEKH